MVGKFNEWLGSLGVEGVEVIKEQHAGLLQILVQTAEGTDDLLGPDFVFGVLTKAKSYPVSARRHTQ